MSDYIKSSREIQEWLKGQGITVEVDEFAPVVDHYLDDLSKHFVCMKKYSHGAGYLCPFFGPGGEGNSLKALLELEKKLPVRVERLHASDCEIAWHYDDFGEGQFHVFGQGKTDGIALHDLLEKLMREKK